MAQLIVSVSGVRGIVGDGLTPEVACRFASALGTYLKGGRVILSRDSRPSGRMLREAAVAGLTSVGCEVLDIGIAPTPTVGVAVREFDAAGAIQITASHNPAPWNGLKLFGSDGAVLSPERGLEVKSLYDRGTFHNQTWDRLGEVRDETEAGMRHLDRVKSQVDVGLIGSKRLKVLIDGNGGAGGPLAQALLIGLGCDVIPLNCDPDGIFHHEAEPVPAHLKMVEEAVREHPGAFGAVLDPDADRLALIDERGRCLSEELTLALAVEHRLSQASGPIVVNMSSSRVTHDLANRAGVPFYRAAVGEANVVAKMLATNALIGGEGNGGVIDPNVGLVRDPYIGLALILDRMASTGKTLGQLADALPQYHIHKEKYAVPREKLAAALTKLAERWPDAQADRTDGLRLDWEDRWLHVRGSNTEPVVRAIAEAPTSAEAKKLCADAGAILRAV